MAKYQCKTVDSKKLVDVFGKTVTMDNSTFDPNFVDKQGRTNVQRMEQGLAPIGRDGKSVNGVVPCKCSRKIPKNLLN